MIHPKMQYVYVGIDSHKDTHCAVVLNCFFEKLGEITFVNAPAKFEAFFREVQKLKPQETKLAFGLEDVSAYGRSLTVFLTRKKQVVKHVNASLVAAERRSRNVLHKTDSEDAECAARVLLNRFDQLPDADPQDKYWVLTNLVTRRRSIVKMNIFLKNHLHSLLASHYPSYRKFFLDIACESSLIFFEKYPSPSRLESVAVGELAEILKHPNPRHRWEKAEQILNHVAQDGETKVQYQEARDLAVKSTINQINSNLKELESIDIILKELLMHFDYNLQSMKGIDTVMAANLIAEIGDISRFPTPAKLARYSGIAPVTYASGKNAVQFANQRGNRTLSALFYSLAVIVTMTAGPRKKIINPFFYHYYHRKISEGKTKRQALKCVERRLVNIIWSMMTYKSEYINPPAQDFPKEAKVEST